MPNFLKALFKPTSNRASRSRRSGPLSPNVAFSAQQGQRDESDSDLVDLLNSLLINDSNSTPDIRERLEELRHQPDSVDLRGQTVDRLIEMLEDIRDGEDGRVTPFVGDHDSGSRERIRSTRRKGKEKAHTASSSSGGTISGGRWQEAMENCDAALALAEKLLKSRMGRGSPNAKLLDRICGLLEAQREELIDMRTYAEGHRLPTLGTLAEIYTKMRTGLQDVRGMEESDGEVTLTTLVSVLQEGPDYLIDVTIIEAMIWQAEVIDPEFGRDIREILDHAVAKQADLATFRKAAESIIAISSALSQDHFERMEDIEAYKAIGVLLKQLQMRVNSSIRGTSTESETLETLLTRTRTLSSDSDLTPTPATGSSTPSPFSSPGISPVASRSASPDTTYQTYSNAADIQSVYGTGPVPTPATNSGAVTPATRKPPSESDTEDEEPEVWEYRGNLLTRSALSLVMRQEAMAMADSSGQYAGEVSWDEYRNAWIPKWAEKYKEEDLVDGEVPSTNPADYRIKRKDAWGNRIGWNDGVMYYEEEPKFHLR